MSLRVGEPLRGVRERGGRETNEWKSGRGHARAHYAIPLRGGRERGGEETNQWKSDSGRACHIMQLDPARPMCAKSNLIEGRMNYIRTASLLIFHNYIFQAKSNTIFVSTIIFNINFCMRQEIVIICSLYCVPLCCKTLISR